MTGTAKIGPIPQIGYGTWTHLGDECRRNVLTALEVGYRHIDTAELYRNERDVGQALAQSGLPRDQVFLTTKVATGHFGPGRIVPTVRRSLERLGTGHADLILLHWPSVDGAFRIEDYIPQLGEVLDLGLARHIGVSNFTRPLIDRTLELLEGRPLATNQCEIHAYLQNRLVAYHCAARGIPMTAYCPLARGRIVDDPVLSAIAAAHDIDAASVALAFLLHEGHVVIPSSGNPVRIAANFAARDINLTDAQMTQIRALDRGLRLVDGPWAPEWDV